MLYDTLSPTLNGMDITLVKKLLEHPDLHKLVKQLKRESWKTLITVPNDVEKNTSRPRANKKGWRT